METVEDLVVGEETEPEVVVDETLVQRLVDALEAEAALLCEDVLQSFYLLRAVGQHEELVAFQEVVLQSLRQQVEVLVEQGLRTNFEGNSRPISLMGLIGPISTMPQHNMPEGLRQGVELCACGEQRLALHLLFYLLGFHLRSSLQALFHGLRREALLIGSLDSLAGVVVAAEHEDGIVG